jgi:hypothetical protein
MVHRNTELYIARNEVKPCLGKNIQVLARFILLTVS